MQASEQTWIIYQSTGPDDCILGCWGNSLMISLSHWQLENLTEPTWVCTTICLVSILYNGGILAGAFTGPCLLITLFPPREEKIPFLGVDGIRVNRRYFLGKKKPSFYKWFLLSTAHCNSSPWYVTHEKWFSRAQPRAAGPMWPSAACAEIY